MPKTKESKAKIMSVKYSKCKGECGKLVGDFVWRPKILKQYCVFCLKQKLSSKTLKKIINSIPIKNGN